MSDQPQTPGATMADLLRNIAGLDDANLFVSSHDVLVAAVKEWRDQARELISGEQPDVREAQFPCQQCDNETACLNRSSCAIAAAPPARSSDETAEDRLATAIKVVRSEQCPFRDGPMADAWAEAWATFLNRLLTRQQHDIDCAIYNAPALPVGLCNCSLSRPPPSVETADALSRPDALLETKVPLGMKAHPNSGVPFNPRDSDAYPTDDGTEKPSPVTRPHGGCE